MTTDEINVRLTASASNFNTEIKGAKRNLEDFGKTGVDASDKIQNAFGSLKNTIATLGIGKLIKDTMDAAGDLEQSLGGARSVFKDFSGELERSADSAASSLGLEKANTCLLPPT